MSRSGWFLLLLTLWPGMIRAEAVHVAVTASFAQPLRQLQPWFAQQTGHELVLSSGSSGKLYAQIRNGAPYHLFLGADEIHSARLLQEGLAVPGSGFVYAIGRLVLFAPGGALVPDGPRALANGSLKRIALANPETAPYGRAAREVLRAMDLWSVYQGRMAIGENVGHALAFIQSGAVDAGFVAYSQILDDRQHPLPGGVWEPASGEYAPLRHEGVVLHKGAGRRDVMDLVTFLTSAPVRAALVRMGFGALP